MIKKIQILKNITLYNALDDLDKLHRYGYEISFTGENTDGWYEINNIGEFNRVTDPELLKQLTELSERLKN